IALEAAPIDSAHTFLHLSYSYRFGTISRMAMQGYLATSGSGKVGFTVTGNDTQGHPQLVGGMRGVMERNTMRYFLAIDAFLETLSAPGHSRLEKRMGAWFDAN